jgi:hypothetical protein
MKPRIEEKLFSLGCLLVLIGVCAFSYLAFFSHWTYSVAVVGLIAGWLLVCRIRARRDHRRHLAALSAAFSSSSLPLPRLKSSYSYGYPSFTLTFSSEAELKQAEESGFIAAFKQAIQSLYMHTGRKQNPFDADRAVWATYDGWQPRFTTS